MNIELTTNNLLTVAGNAAFIWLVLRLLIKPWLRVRYPALPDGRTNPNYSGLMNVAAVVVGLIGAIAASFVPAVSYASILDAILIGLGGAALAVGLNEGVGNMAAAVKR